jgi:hypothetical protein
MLKPALIHLDPTQKARLTKRARLRGSSFSREVRQALDLYLDLPPEGMEELASLARAANRSADRTLAHLDDAIETVGTALRRAGRK